MSQGKRKKVRGLAGMPLRQLWIQQRPDIALGLIPYLDWKETEARAKAGDVAAAQALLQRIVVALRGNAEGNNETEFVPLPACMARYLVDAMESILGGQNVERALNLVRNPGSHNFLRDDWIEFVVDHFQLSGMSPQESYEKAANLLDEIGVSGPRDGWSAGTVNKIMTKRRRKKHP